MELRYDWYDSLNTVSGIWDSILPVNHSLRSEWLLVLEQSRPEDVHFHYLVLYDTSENAVALGYFQKVRFTRRNYQSPFSKVFLQALENRLTGRGFEILVCGNLLKIDAPGIFFLPEKVNGTIVYHTILQFLETYQHKVSAHLWKDLPEDADFDSLGREGFSEWLGDATMKLHIRPEWKSGADYVQALKHRYSQRFRKIRKAAARVQRMELDAGQLEQEKMHLISLYHSVVEKQTIRMILVNAHYFSLMKSSLGERFRVYAYYLDQKMVAFSSNIVYDELWELHFIGLDYSANARHQLYFNILFDAIQDAINHGSKEVEMGRTSREAKANTGAGAVAFRNFVKLNGWVTRGIVWVLRRTFNQTTGDNWQLKKPFRSETGQP